MPESCSLHGQIKSRGTEIEEAQQEQPQEIQTAEEEPDAIEEDAVKEAVSDDASMAEINIKGWRLLGDCPTRWGSAFKMISRALKMEDDVKAFTARYQRKTYTISLDEWSILKTVHGLLQPFTKLATSSETDKYPGLPLVVPYYNLLLETLTTEAESKSCVLDLLSECNIETKPALLIGRDQGA